MSSAGRQEIFTTTVIANEAITYKRFVQWDGTHSGSGEYAAGVARTNAANGEFLPVDVIGVLEVEAGGAVAVGVEIESDASGRAITRSAGKVLGRSTTATNGAGETLNYCAITN